MGQTKLMVICGCWRGGQQDYPWILWYLDHKCQIYPRPSPCIGLEEQMYHLYQAKYHPWQMFTMDKTEESTILTGDSHILICQGFQAIMYNVNSPPSQHFVL